MTRPPEPWRIVLVVEDDSDGRAVAELVSRSGQDVTVDWLPPCNLAARRPVCLPAPFN